MKQDEYDVIVVGAGVVGCCAARELARFELRVLVLEAGLDLACGATRANSGIVHAGYDPEPGTLKARYNVEGAALFPQWQRELGFAYFRNGALVLAFDDDGRAALGKLLERAAANGVEGCSIVEADELWQMEPNVSPEAVCALDVPASGVCDPYGLTYAAAENAAANGVEFRFGCRVRDIEREGDGFAVAVEGGAGRYAARAVVNAAGVHADEINNLASERKIEIAPRKGEYLLYDSELAGTFQRTMLQVPGAQGKGVLVASVAFGNPFIGPSAEDVRDKNDISTTEAGQRSVLEAARRTWPDASADGVIATYAGLRARDASGAGDFIVGEAADAPGFFNAACIDSPGLASAPAIAVDLAGMVARRLGARAREGFDPVRVPAPLLAMMDDEAAAALVNANPLYGNEVCHCCHVSEGELVDAMHRALPVLCLDALKWRTGATMGPCHGGRCTTRIMEVALRELGAALPLKRDAGSEACPAPGSCLPRSEARKERQAPDLGRHEPGAALAEIDALLEGRGLREVGSGSLGIAGTRPAGVYSAAEAIGLMAATGRPPGTRAVVWGTHDAAAIATRALADAGVEIARVLEPDARVVSVTGAARLDSVTIEVRGTREQIPCDLLLATPFTVPLAHLL